MGILEEIGTERNNEFERTKEVLIGVTTLVLNETNKKKSKCTFNPQFSGAVPDFLMVT